MYGLYSIKRTNPNPDPNQLLHPKEGMRKRQEDLKDELKEALEYFGSDFGPEMPFEGFLEMFCCAESLQLPSQKAS